MEKNMYTLQLNEIVTTPLSISFHLLIRLCHLQWRNSFWCQQRIWGWKKKKKNHRNGYAFWAFTILNTVSGMVNYVHYGVMETHYASENVCGLKAIVNAWKQYSVLYHTQGLCEHKKSWHYFWPFVCQIKVSGVTNMKEAMLLSCDKRTIQWLFLFFTWGATPREYV